MPKPTELEMSNLLDSPVFPPISPTSNPASPTSPPISPTSPPLSPLFMDFLDFDLNDVDFNIYSFLNTTINNKKDDLKNKISAKTSALNQKIREKKLKLKKKLREQKTVRARDKFAFVLGITNIWFTCAMMFIRPTIFPYYYTLSAIVLISLRFLLYKPKQWHYFTADLCYNVNALTIAFLYFCSNSSFMWTSLFGLANGPVAWAIYAWRNSLVFHSVDKVTSVWIHISPPLVLYTIRWLSGSLGRINNYIKAQDKLPYGKFAFDPLFPDKTIEISFWEMMSYSMIMYSIWQLGYYYFILVRQKQKVESGVRATSYTWMVADYLTNKQSSILTRFFLKFDEKWHKWLYMGVQFVYATASTVPTFLMYKYFWVHTVFVTFIFMMSVFNGADYYIEVFSRRYRIELQKLEESLEQDESLLEATFGCSTSRASGKAENPANRKTKPISVKDIMKEN